MSGVAAGSLGHSPIRLPPMIALARKYRPKSFSDLIAQDHVAAVLRGAVAGGRVAHGYLFAGPRGVGKTTAARILAMALNCERRGAAGGLAGEPCGECDSCTRIWTGAANLDVVELDAASNRGVDDARDLRERAMYAASTETRSKVYIVDEAHMLTREAWNALLKILEEPPPRVAFVFATTEPQKIALSAAPILSRLQRFDFRRIGPHAIVERLRHVAAAEGLAVEDDAFHLIAKSADGGMRDALSILDQVLSFGEGPLTAGRVREVLGLISDELYGELLRVVAERDVTGVFPLVDRLVEAGADLGEFVSGAGETLRAVLAVGVGGEAEGMTEGLQALLRGLGKELGKGEGERGTSGSTPVLRDAAPASPVPPPPSPAVVPEKGPLELDRLRALWPRIIEDARARSPLLGALLAVTEVAVVQGATVGIRLLDTNAVHAEGIERQRDALAQLVGRYVTEPVRITMEGAGSGERSPQRAARMTEEGARQERLRALRANDPSLSAAVDALDLELLE